jgi:hypothetical protein
MLRRPPEEEEKAERLVKVGLSLGVLVLVLDP